jgi:hypothetical protein
MTYASPAWEFAADAHLIKLQRLQNKVLRTIGNLTRRTTVRDLHIAFKFPYAHDYTYIRGLNLAAVNHTAVQVTRLPL